MTTTTNRYHRQFSSKDSSFIRACSYDRKNRLNGTLWVTFASGVTYRYPSITTSRMLDFIAAVESVGVNEAFTTFIRGRKWNRKVTPTTTTNLKMKSAKRGLTMTVTPRTGTLRFTKTTRTTAKR